MAAKKNIPELRFKGFEGEWEEVKLGDLGIVVTGSTPPTQNSSYYSEDGIPWVTPTDICNNVTFNTAKKLSLDGQKVSRIVPENTILATCIASIGKNTLLGTRGSFNQQINGLVPNLDKFEPYFLFSNSFHWSIKMKKIAGAGTMLIVNKTGFSEIYTNTPSLPEQTQIGTYFQNLDSLISLQQSKYNKLLTMKKAMLEKMFPKEGADVPEIRFKGFEGKWEKKTLGSIAVSFEYGLNAAAKEYDGINKYIRITDIDDKSNNFKHDDITSPNTNLNAAENYKLKYGDILFARTGASVGKTYIYKESDGLIFYAGFLIRARIKEEYNPNFVFQKTLSYDYSKFIRFTSQRSGQPGVNAQEYAIYGFLFPERKEQDKIALFFQTLDTLISEQQKQLEKLKNIKKACLEKMFV